MSKSHVNRPKSHICLNCKFTVICVIIKGERKVVIWCRNSVLSDTEENFGASGGDHRLHLERDGWRCRLVVADAALEQRRVLRRFSAVQRHSQSEACRDLKRELRLLWLTPDTGVLCSRVSVSVTGQIGGTV